MTVRRLVALTVVGAMAALLGGPARAAWAAGTIRIRVERSGGEMPGPGTGTWAPLSNLKIGKLPSPPPSYGPYTIPRFTTQVISNVPAGLYSATGATFYVKPCPGVRFQVRDGHTTSLIYDQAPKPPASTVQPCTVKVIGP